MSLTTRAALLGAFAALATAHGTVSGIVADGIYTEGWQLQYYYEIQNGQTPPDTPGWYAEDLDNGFVSPDNYTSPDIICHKNAKQLATTTSATVKAGGTVDFEWTVWPDSHLGPVLTYVADCGGDCADVDKTTLEWVKIDAEGYDEDTQTWASTKMIANNNAWSTTVPSTLKAGNYVFRNEIIALHSAGSENGAQNYPQCLNIAITGDGTDTPAGTVGEKLYTPTDPGILINIYTTITNYTIPGPALYVGGSSGSSSESSTAAASSTVATTTAAASSSAAAVTVSPTTPVAPSTTAAPVLTSSATASAAEPGSTDDSCEPDYDTTISSSAITASTPTTFALTTPTTLQTIVSTTPAAAAAITSVAAVDASTTTATASSTTVTAPSMTGSTGSGDAPGSYAAFVKWIHWIEALGRSAIGGK